MGVLDHPDEGHPAFSMGPKLKESPLLQRIATIDPFAVRVE